MIVNNETARLTQQLVQIESPYFHEDAIISFVQDWLAARQIDAIIHHYHESRITGHHGKNLVVVLEGKENGPTICLNGHLDTVQLCSGWSRDPLGGDMEGDRLYGQGALDMKSGCAAIMVALERFVKTGKPFKGKVIATFVSVEEGPYGMGTNALIEDGILDGVDLSIVPEPSSGFTRAPFPAVCLGARGGYGLEVQFLGKSAHAALPQEGISAALDASKFVQEIDRINHPEDEYLGRGTACVVSVHSDGGACSVPDQATVKLFWHIVRGQSKETIKDQIIEAIAHAGIRSGWKINFREAPSAGSEGFLPYVSDKDHPLVGKFLDSVRNVCGKEPEIAYFQSIGDFNYLGSRLGAPVVIFGPAGENFHGSDEYVLMSTAEQTALGIERYLNDVLRP